MRKRESWGRNKDGAKEDEMVEMERKTLGDRGGTTGREGDRNRQKEQDRERHKTSKRQRRNIGSDIKQTRGKIHGGGRKREIILLQSKYSQGKYTN